MSRLSQRSTVISRQADGPARRGGLLWLAALLLVLSAVLVPTSAHALFGPATFLSNQNRDAFEPQVGIDTEGKGYAIWERFDGSVFRVQMRTRSARGKYGKTFDLSGTNRDAFSPQIAVNESGQAIMTWTRFDGSNDRIQMRTRSAAGNLGSVTTLSDPGLDGEESQVGIDGNGNGFAVWTRSDGTNLRIEGRSISATGTLGPVLQLSPAGFDAFSPQIAMNSAGNGMVVWTRFDGANDRIQSMPISPAGTPGSVKTLSGLGQDAEEPQVGIDATGRAVAVWERLDGTTPSPPASRCCFRIQTRSRNGNNISAVQTLSNANRNAFSPQVAVNAAGNSYIVWTRFDGQKDRIQGRARSATNVLSPTEPLSEAGQDAEEPQVGIDANGKAVAIWERFDGTTFRIQAVVRSPEGVLDPVQTISPAGHEAFSPQIAVSGPGKAFADWTGYDNSFIARVQASYGP